MHYAEMVHFATQITVKALGEGKIVDSTTIFGISVNYQEKMSKVYKLVITSTLSSTNDARMYLFTKQERS